jgi:quercetin dioxygenase-like cupin family protein
LVEKELQMNRRQACTVTAVAVLATAGKLFARAQQSKPASPEPAEDSGKDTPTFMAESHLFRFNEMKVKEHPTGGWSRSVIRGTLPTGEFVEVHQSMLPPGKMPHPAHRHRNTEFMLIREGKLEYICDGPSQTVGPGDVLYAASEQLHGLKNIGETNAAYFVVSVSRREA